MSRVLISTEVPGNAWPLALDLSRALERCGVEVVLAAFGRKLSEAQRRDARDISTLTLEEFPLKVEWMEDAWHDVDEAGRALLALARDSQPDVVQVESYAHGALPFEAPVVLAPHTDLLRWSQHTSVAQAGTPAHLGAFCARARRGLEAADAVVSCTQAALDDLVREHGLRPRGSVVAPGCETANYRPARKENFVITASRSWDGAHNLALLSRVAPALSWPLLAIRDDTRAPEAAGEQAFDGLRMLGERSRADLAETLARASIYVLTGSVDPSGLPVLEAALSGCALVLGESPDLREHWDGAACFVDDHDPSQLRGVLQELIDDPARRETLGSRALERAHHFSADACAEAYLRLYARLLELRA